MAKIFVESLGCPKNLVDTQRMINLLKGSDENLIITDDIASSDTILINTCGFIEPAKKESIEEILLAIEEKKRDPNKKIVVAGCLYQRYKNALAKELPEVDYFIGVNELDKITEIAGKKGLIKECTDSVSLTPKHIGYLKISEGCSNNCTFCTIPAIRGQLRSFNPESVIKKAEIMAERGVKELYIIAQDTTAYMYEKGKRNELVNLLEKIEEIKGIEWIRLMYTYPAYITDELINFIAGSKKTVHYIDMPLQHINNGVLNAMGRQYRRKDVEQLIEKLRNKIPDIALRTTFIVGFPNETEKAFNELCDFIEQAQFDWAGFFKFYSEEGTMAHRFQDLDETVKIDRVNIAEKLQNSVYESTHSKMIGEKITVITDEHDDNYREYTPSRSYRSAFEIDGIIFIKDKNIRTGMFKNVQIVEKLNEVDFLAKVVEPALD